MCVNNAPRGRTVEAVPLIAGLAVLWFMVIAWATKDGRDAANDGRSIDRHSHAMRVLSRRGAPARPAGVAGRYIVVPTTAVTDPAAKQRNTVVERRRRILRGLVVTSGLSFAGILLGGPWLVIHLLVDVLLVAYVVTLRRTTLRAAEAARRTRRRTRARRRCSRCRSAWSGGGPSTTDGAW
jgi:hypothetical protein